MRFRKLATQPQGNMSMEATAVPKQNILSKTGRLFTRAGKGIINGLKKKNTYVELICALLIILFIYTGVNKLWDYDNFKLQMGRSPFIQNMSGFIAATLPAGEILLALMLVVKRTRLLGLYLSFILMALFTGYIWLMLNYASDLPCSCGGVLSEMTWNDHLYFNAAFTGLAMLGVILQSSILATKKKALNTGKV